MCITFCYETGLSVIQLFYKWDHGNNYHKPNSRCTGDRGGEKHPAQASQKPVRHCLYQVAWLCQMGHFRLLLGGAEPSFKYKQTQRRC